MQQGLKEQAVSITLDHAFYEADLGYRQQALAAADLALRMIPDSVETKAFAALTFARVGDIRRAEALTNDVTRQPSLGTIMNNVVLPCVRAAMALASRNPAAAIEELRRAVPYDLSTPPDGVAMYYRGLGYLELQSEKEAATQFQKILNNRGTVPTSIYWPLAHLGLGRARALAGDTVGARTAYQDFFSLWRDADPDVPILKQAKAEYATLSRRVP